MLSNAYFLAKFRLDTAENEPAKNLQILEKCIFEKCIFENRGNFLLQYEKPKRGGDPVLTTLADLIRKLFNARNFKGLVSPHEFLQAVRDRFRVCRSNASDDF